MVDDFRSEIRVEETGGGLDRRNLDQRGYSGGGDGWRSREDLGNRGCSGGGGTEDEDRRRDR